MSFSTHLLVAATAATLLATACAAGTDDAPQPDGPTAFLELPLESLADDGAPVRIVGASLHLESATDSVPVAAPIDEGVFSHALPLDLKRVTLTGAWHLEAMQGGEWQPLEGRLAGASVWEAPSLIADEVTEVGFRFQTALGPVTLGQTR